ncbi:MAG: amidohydrolase, partial [Nevskia sp.]|nr:amidohydrolase [Nevskia sp.]
RMAYQGEYFVERYGAKAAERTPPFKRMLEMGVKVGAGTDATRVASYDPWNALYWLTTGKTLGGLSLYPGSHCVDRETALQLYTQANTWFSNEEGLKGQLVVGQLADFVLLSEDYFAVTEARIRQIVSVLTVVDGRIVYGDDEFRDLDPPIPQPLPDWSPVNFGSRYWKDSKSGAAAQSMSACACSTACGVHGHAHAYAHEAPVGDAERGQFWGALGCSCWAF